MKILTVFSLFRRLPVLNPWWVASAVCSAPWTVPRSGHSSTPSTPSWQIATACCGVETTPSERLPKLSTRSGIWARVSSMLQTTPPNPERNFTRSSLILDSGATMWVTLTLKCQNPKWRHDSHFSKTFSTRPIWQPSTWRRGTSTRKSTCWDPKESPKSWTKLAFNI